VSASAVNAARKINHPVIRIGRIFIAAEELALSEAEGISLFSAVARQH
jgi:hypothetical protein